MKRPGWKQRQAQPRKGGIRMVLAESRPADANVGPRRRGRQSSEARHREIAKCIRIVNLLKPHWKNPQVFDLIRKFYIVGTGRTQLLEIMQRYGSAENNFEVNWDGPDGALVTELIAGGQTESEFERRIKLIGEPRWIKMRCSQNVLLVEGMRRFEAGEVVQVKTFQMRSFAQYAIINGWAEKISAPYGYP